MKKNQILFTCVLLVFALALSAGNREFNIFVGGGAAVNDVDGPVMDLGAEMQVGRKIFLQFLFDYYFNPVGVDFSIPEIGLDLDTSLYGFNLYVVYKHPLGEKLKLLGKFGLNLTSVWARVTVLGLEESATASEFGLGAGAGLEYKITPKFALFFTSVYKLLTTIETPNWFKFTGGISFTISK